MPHRETMDAILEDAQVAAGDAAAAASTGTLTFGYFGKSGQPVYDKYKASPLQIAEDGKKHLRTVA
jgi:hypothetical protein